MDPIPSPAYSTRFVWISHLCRVRLIAFLNSKIYSRCRPLSCKITLMTDSPVLDFEKFLGSFPQFGGDGALSIEVIAKEQPNLVKDLEQFHPIRAASLIAGLMGVPGLQSSGYRIETLLHLSLAFCQGNAKPRGQNLARWYREIGQGICGMQEDPAEDVFVSNILSSRGNFRVLEGLWEGGTFYLQRIVNILESLPTGARYSNIKESTLSLLRLSEELCRRFGLSRYDLGNENPAQSLSKEIQKQSKELQGLVRFSRAEIISIGIDIASLQEFLFIPADRQKIIKGSTLDSVIVRRPLCFHNDFVYVINPTAISATLRYFVIEKLFLAGLRSNFLAALADEFSAALSDIPLLGGARGAPLRFQRLSAGWVAEILAEIDAGRFLHVLVFQEELDGFETTGLGGMAPENAPLDLLIEERVLSAQKYVEDRPGHVDGHTVLVACGVGRGLRYNVPHCPRNWSITPFSVHDFATLGWYSKFKPLSLWRLKEAESVVQKDGVKLLNINGPLNLIAWQRRLDGHLVPHGQLPDGFGAGASMILVEQNAIRELRSSVLKEHDPHVDLFPDGSTIYLRRLADSIFDEDKGRPLFVGLNFVGAGLPLLYRGRKCKWWSTFEISGKTPDLLRYERWKLCSTWIPRIAQAFESTDYKRLPSEIWIHFSFELPQSVRRKLVGFMGSEEIRASVTKHASGHRLNVATDDRFENGFLNPKNVAERVLVETCVAGVLEICGISEIGLVDSLMKQIVTSDLARQSHAFEARAFRDFVSDKIPRNPILLDDVDVANLKFGMGWRVRSRQAGSDINGRSDCITYLSSLVIELENDLCSFVGGFNRKEFLFRILQNYESAFLDRNTWRRTAAAILALHDDKAATVAKMVEHEAKLNMIFQTCRVLLEMSNCETQEAGGRTPGILDISKLMAMVAQVTALGGWSDAIRWDAMEPRLRITPLGDVHANHEYYETIVEPFGLERGRVLVEQSSSSYDSFFEGERIVETLSGRIEDEFLAAWNSEFGAELDRFREFVDECENIFIKWEKPFDIMKQSEFFSVIAESSTLDVNSIRTITQALLYAPRAAWKAIPEGLVDADRQPWRYRRRLSVLRKPIVQVTEGDDPELLIAPSLVRDALAYSVANYHSADFADGQIVSSEMRRWVGRARASREKFNREVADALLGSGWAAECDLQLTKLLGIGSDPVLGDIKRFGDIDVLAWDKSSSRVMVLECKDVQYKKTPGEIAEQLSKFRGIVGGDGKPDLLKRHLDRLELCTQKRELVAKYTGVQYPVIEGYLMFRNPVPMVYAEASISKKMNLRLYSNISKDFSL